MGIYQDNNFRFHKFLGTSHINNRNIAVYVSSCGCLLVSENVATDHVYSELEFSSLNEAEKWFEDQGSTNINRLYSAIEKMADEL